MKRKITIGTNYFLKGNSHREEVAMSSLLRLKDKFDNIELLSIQFEDDDISKIPEKFRISTCLKRSSKDLNIGSNKKLPFVNDILNSISLLSPDSEFIIFTNSDVILSDRIVKTIEENVDIIETMAFSRLDIRDIASIDQPNTIEPVRWEIAGFDTLLFKNDWYKDHSPLFRDYLLGKPFFDWAYAGIMSMHSNFGLGNKNPANCFHIHHGISSVTDICPERDFNKRSFYQSTDVVYSKHIEFYINNILKKRTPYGSFLNCLENEEKIEKEFFSQFRVREV